MFKPGDLVKLHDGLCLGKSDFNEFHNVYFASPSLHSTLYTEVYYVITTISHRSNSLTFFDILCEDGKTYSFFSLSHKNYVTFEKYIHEIKMYPDDKGKHEADPKNAFLILQQLLDL